MTTRNGTNPTDNPTWAMRQLRAAIGRGGSVEIDGSVYSVQVARSRYNYGSSDAKREEVLVRKDKKGDYVALEWPRQNGAKASGVRINVSADGSSRAAPLSIRLDPVAQAQAIAAAKTILTTLYTPLLAEYGRYNTALMAYSAATGKSLKALETKETPQLTKDTAFADAVEAVLTLRNDRLVSVRGATTSESTRLAERVMRTMTTRPETVATFAAMGYAVETRDVDYSTPDWQHTTHQVAMLTKSGAPVHVEPARAPGNLNDRVSGGAGATTESLLAFLSDATRLAPVLAEPRSLMVSSSEGSVEERIALIKEALGDGDSDNPLVIEAAGATYSNRLVGVRWGDDAGSNQGSVLFRVPARDPRIPAALRLDSAVEWPVDGTRAVALTTEISTKDRKSADAARALYGTACSDSGNTLTCVDTQMDSNGRMLASRDAEQIVRAALAAEMARYAEFRDLLANSPVNSGREAAAKIDATLPTVSADTPLREIVDTINQVRESAIGAAEAAIYQEAHAVTAALYNILSNSTKAYEEGLKRGYDLRGFDVPYQTNKGTRWHTVVLVSCKDPVSGEPVPMQNPPASHPTETPSRMIAPAWPEIDKATAMRLMRDAVAISAMVSGPPTRQGMAE